MSESPAVAGKRDLESRRVAEDLHLRSSHQGLSALSALVSRLKRSFERSVPSSLNLFVKGNAGSRMNRLVRGVLFLNRL